MDKEAYLKKRFDKALMLADEFGYIIEHTLGVTIKGDYVPKGLDFRKEREVSFQSQKLYKLMKDFLDYSLETDDSGEVSEELLNKYLEDMDSFSFHPKLDGNIFEFSMQDHVYKIEVVLGAIISMTLIINDELIQTRMIEECNDFSAIMRILDTMKEVYKYNPELEDDKFQLYYNNILQIINTACPEWTEIEKKVFVPYSMQNDLYFSPYNIDSFMEDFYLEVELAKSTIPNIENVEERKMLEILVDMLFKFKAGDPVDMFNKDILSFNPRSASMMKNFQSVFFQEIIKKLTKKHTVLNRIKELKKELASFSDVKPVEEYISEAEEEYGLLAVKKVLDSKDKDEFLKRAVLMTPIDSVGIVEYIAGQNDKYIMDRAFIFIECMTRYIIPLQTEHIEKISSIISADPIALLRQVAPEQAEDVFGDTLSSPVEVDINLKDKLIEAMDLQEKLGEKFKEEEEFFVKQTAKEIIGEMNDLEDAGDVEWSAPESGVIPNYHLQAFNKAIDKVLSSDLIVKMAAEIGK